MDKKDYTIIPLAIALVASLFFGIQPEPTHYCETEQTQRYCFDISGGLHTWCYTDPERNSWDYCKTGWEPIPEWAKETQECKIFANGCMHYCEIDDYKICRCENGNFAYWGEIKER